MRFRAYDDQGQIDGLLIRMESVQTVMRIHSAVDTVSSYAGSELRSARSSRPVITVRRKVVTYGISERFDLAGSMPADAAL